MDELIGKYKLSQEELDEIYQAEIFEEYIKRSTPSENPKMIFSTAQQGSGKTVLSAYAMQKFAGKRKQVISFSRDDLRRYDPNRDDVSKNHKQQYSLLTSYNSSYWRDKLIEDACKHKLNIVFEAVLKNDRYEAVKNAIMIAKNSGYKIQCWGLATNQNISLYSMFNRYEGQIETTGEGDIPPHPKNHDEAYQEFPLLIQKMMDENVFDKLRVVDRVGNEYYNSATDRDTNFIEVINNVRNQFYQNPNWKKDMLQQWDVILDKMKDRNAPEQEVLSAIQCKNRTKNDTGSYDINKDSIKER